MTAGTVRRIHRRTRNRTAGRRPGIRPRRLTSITGTRRLGGTPVPVGRRHGGHGHVDRLLRPDGDADLQLADRDADDQENLDPQERPPQSAGQKSRKPVLDRVVTPHRPRPVVGTDLPELRLSPTVTSEHRHARSRDPPDDRFRPNPLSSPQPWTRSPGATMDRRMLVYLQRRCVSYLDAIYSSTDGRLRPGFHSGP